MKNLTDWENTLRQQLSGAEEEVPSSGWEKLMERMASDGTSEPLAHPAVSAKKPLGLRLWKIAAPLTAAAACTAVAFLFVQHNENNMGEQVANLNKAHAPSVSPKANVLSPDNTEKALAQSLPKRPLTAKSETNKLYTPKTQDLKDDSVKESTTAETAQTFEASAQESNTKESIRHENNETTSAKVQQKPLGQTALAYIRNERRKSVSHVPSLSLYSAAGSTASASQAGYVMVAATSSLQNSTNNKVSPNEALGAVTQSNLNQYADSRVTHKMPVKVGLSVNVPLTSRLSLHTGLNYTLLSSEIVSGTDNSYYQTDQTLHYVGLPVGVSYAFLNTRYIDLYGSAGIEIDKCVKGLQTTDFNANNAFKAQVETEENIGKSVWQSSANVSLGFQFNIVPTVGIYAEPGVTYYPSDGSSLLTVWRDKPWQFSLQVGLRLSPFKAKK